ncbi:MAG: MOSC domain-containing protein [Chloroflexota bacterium]
MPKIHSIVYQPKDQHYTKRMDSFIRVPLPKAILIANHGIEGDDKAGRNPNRQLNLLSIGWLNRMTKKGYNPTPGQFGEQIILKDLAFITLKSGDKIQLGESAIIEITKPRTGCTRLEMVQRDFLTHTNGMVGLLAKVLVGGEIKIGDQVKVPEPINS